MLSKNQLPGLTLLHNVNKLIGLMPTAYARIGLREIVKEKKMSQIQNKSIEV